MKGIYSFLSLKLEIIDINDVCMHTEQQIYMTIQSEWSCQGVKFYNTSNYKIIRDHYLK